MTKQGYLVVEAYINLFAGKRKRKTPFLSGYRPLFDFPSAGTKLSGRIDLLGRKYLEPGVGNMVNITFLRGIIDDAHFKTGAKFSFSEGTEILGTGEISQVLTT